MTYCKGCLEKQRKINELEQEITSLKAKLRYQQRTAKKGFFGSSTPSSKVPVKPNSPTEQKCNHGGGKVGHQGHGRASICQQDADKVQRICISNICPDCGSTLEDKGTRTRTVIDCQPVRIKKVLYHLAKRLKNVPNALIQSYRQAPVKHADETGWRTDGQNGYSWLFCTPDISIFRFRKSRSASVAREVFGQKALAGVLVVERYNGYNKVPCLIQYCYAHLLRDVRDLEKDFPENAEIKSFVEALAPQLANAISLRTLDITDKQFKRQAAKIKSEIIKITNHQARHPAIQKIQDIFREKADRLYHWAEDHSIPADNNLAERELRPLVIARKISFGSQSDAGARTREILMTILHTLKKRTPDVTSALKSALDQLTEQDDIDLYKVVFNFDSS